MKKDIKFYLKLFTTAFNLSAFTFGGGYIIVPLMRKRFVNELKWIEEEEMLDLAAIAQSCPGAIAVNASILVGYRLAGILGTIITVVATVLPPLIILSVISIGYTEFQNSLIVKYVLKGMQAGVAAVIVDVVINMAQDVIKVKNILPIVLMVGSFVAAFIFNVNVIYIVLFCGVLGAISVIYKNRSQKKEVEQ